MIQLAYVFAAPVVIAAAPVGGIDINNTLSYLALGLGGVTGWKVISLLLDKIVPSRTDRRSDVESSFSVLSKTIEILSSEKSSDSEALQRANTRIKELETEGESDYKLIRVLKETKDDLERRISQKDAHIAELTQTLAEYGAKVWFDGTGMLHIDASKVHEPTTGPIPTR